MAEGKRGMSSVLIDMTGRMFLEKSMLYGDVKSDS